MEQLNNPGRRRVLATTGGLVAMAGLGGTLSGKAQAAAASDAAAASKPLPAYAAWKNADSLVVHSANTMETHRWSVGSGGLTPLNSLYVRNNLNPPSEQITEKPDEWVLEVKGVKNPRSFTVAELKTLGLTSVPMVLQCSGNGRAWFPHNPSGTQWTVGAAGCVVFTGVPVKAVIEATGGVADGMKFMTSTGGEEIPAGLDPNTVKVERSVPVDGIEDALLAWEVNGEALPLAHGGPLRVIMPGYMGVNSVKYIKQLAFTEEQSKAKIQQGSYRMSPVGTKGNPTFEPVWAMPVKSWVTSPSNPDETVKAGKVLIRGVAFGGMSEAKSVEVSVNGGKDWEKATFVGPDLGKYAWREFVLATTLEPGTYEMVSRAKNADGDEQPEERVENNRGYMNTSWRDHMVKIKVA